MIFGKLPRLASDGLLRLAGWRTSFVIGDLIRAYTGEGLCMAFFHSPQGQFSSWHAKFRNRRVGVTNAAGAYRSGTQETEIGTLGLPGIPDERCASVQTTRCLNTKGRSFLAVNCRYRKKALPVTLCPNELQLWRHPRRGRR